MNFDMRKDIFRGVFMAKKEKHCCLLQMFMR